MAKKKDNRNATSRQDVRDPPGGIRPPVLAIDFEEFAHFLEGSGMSEEDACRYLQTMWTIVCEIVSLGFGVHPVQQAQKTCGKLGKDAPQAPSTAADEVEWESKFLIDNFEDATGLETEPEAEGVKL